MLKYWQHLVQTNRSSLRITALFYWNNTKLYCVLTTDGVIYNNRNSVSKRELAARHINYLYIFDYLISSVSGRPIITDILLF